MVINNNLNCFHKPLRFLDFLKVPQQSEKFNGIEFIIPLSGCKDKGARK